MFMFLAWWMVDGMPLLLDYFWQIFVFQMYFFQIKISFLLFYMTIIFIHFCNVFALSLKISSVLNTRLPGSQLRARYHIVLEYNNENTRFIRLPLVNQFAYIFRSNDNYDKLLFFLKRRKQIFRSHNLKNLEK